MRKRWIAALALIVVTGVACGRGGDASADASSLGGEAAKRAEMQDALIEYAKCMRENGIDMPDPEIDDRGVVKMEAGDPEANLDELSAAQEACGDLMPEMEEPSDEEKAEMEDEMLEFAECMRENGVDVPDPGEDGAIVGGEKPEVDSAVDFDDPDFQRAREACGDLLPGMEGGS